MIFIFFWLWKSHEKSLLKKWSLCILSSYVWCSSAVKVISQPDPQFGHGGSSDNPLSVLGQALFPAGSTNAPMEQLQQFYRLGVQAMSKAQSAGGETRSNSTLSTGNYCKQQQQQQQLLLLLHRVP